MKRREFLQMMMAGTAALGTANLLRPDETRAQALAGASQAGPGTSPRPLNVVNRTLNINGKAARVFGLVQPDGTQGLTLDAESIYDVNLTNSLDAPTLIHWHGLTPPWVMDGVPDVPAPLLRPSESRRYTFPVGAGGTHWMHAHTLQEQNLLAAPLIVRSAADRQRDEQEVVILLHDFSFTPAEELLAKLKGDNSAAHGTSQNRGAMNHGATMGNMMGNMASQAMGHMKQGNSMPGMGAMDINDIEYDAYLANDRALDDPQVVQVETGGRIRLRIINGATATAFTIDTGGLGGELIAVDGQSVTPVKGGAFPIAMGQRLDIRLEISKTGGSYPILALREGAPQRAGLILATRGAAVKKIPVSGRDAGPVLGLDLEQRLRAMQPLASRAPDRRFALTLTGNMAGYSWGIDGAEALRVRRGDRVEITLANMSMMAHPIHLHGHRFQVVGINGRTFAGAVRDTVLVPHMASVTVAFDALNPGRWAFHCHHLYHMATGMMAFVAYEGIG